MTVNDFFVNVLNMKHQLNPAELVISRFGGQTSLSALLGKRQSTVQHWAKTGRIPSQWHAQLMQVARDKGIALEPKDFVAMESPSIQRADGKLGIMLVGLGAVSST